MKKTLATAALTLITAATLTPAAHAGPVAADTTVRATTTSHDATLHSKWVPRKHIKKYHLTAKQLRNINKAARWARQPTARKIVQRESGGNYRINTGNGYYGAWQFLQSTWLANGGGRYARYPHQAPRWAQDHIAYRAWRKAGWQPWYPVPR